MRTLLIVLQIAAALGLLNVWLLRAGRQTAYRGGGAATMREEFTAYGLPAWMMYAIGALKVAIALLLIIGIWVPTVVVPAAVVLSVLMIGALTMHVKIGDPVQKSVPALAMLALSVAIVLVSQRL